MKLRTFCPAVSIVLFPFCVACGADTPQGVPVVKVSAQMAAPAWAVLERQLMAVNAQIAGEWDRAYLRADGSTNAELIHGGGVQAPGDFFECIYKMPLLYALGAPDATGDVYWKAFKGSLKPLEKRGLFKNEMVKYLDWHHNGEHYEGFWLLALCVPQDGEYRRPV